MSSSADNKARNPDGRLTEIELRLWETATIGPLRVAHGEQNLVVVATGATALVVRNRDNTQPAFVRVQSATPGAGAFVFSGSPNPNIENGITIPLGTANFECILMPSDSLYARNMGADARIVASLVVI